MLEHTLRIVYSVYIHNTYTDYYVNNMAAGKFNFSSEVNHKEKPRKDIRMWFAITQLTYRTCYIILHLKLNFHVIRCEALQCNVNCKIYMRLMI